jgi:hypothetical protein
MEEEGYHLEFRRRAILDCLLACLHRGALTPQRYDTEIYDISPFRKISFIWQSY